MDRLRGATPFLEKDGEIEVRVRVVGIDSQVCPDSVDTCTMP
jgi:hypothetical protein